MMNQLLHSMPLSAAVVSVWLFICVFVRVCCVWLRFLRASESFPNVRVHKPSFIRTL